jgi:hypothetical protein
LTVLGGRQAMPSWAKVLGNRTIGGKEALGMSGGLESLHPLLPLAGGWLGSCDAYGTLGWS